VNDPEKEPSRKGEEVRMRTRRHLRNREKKGVAEQRERERERRIVGPETGGCKATSSKFLFQHTNWGL